jgi:hypothetical protein
MATSMTMDGTQVAARIQRAHDLMAHDHRSMLLELNDLFRRGRVPPAWLDGPCQGTLVTTIFGRGADRSTHLLGSFYMPWRGKAFDAATQSGINLFSAASKPLIRPFDPAVRDDSRPDLVRAYPFRTYLAPGVIDRDRRVLKIDYDIPSNPFGLIRRVLDELVEVAPGYFLGKAHLRALGHWRTVAYFTLETP